MKDEVPDEQTAKEIATEYAKNECIGTLGEVIEIESQNSDWIVEFRTHTFSDEYDHRVRITKSVGNVIAHDRLS